MAINAVSEKCEKKIMLFMLFFIWVLFLTCLGTVGGRWNEVFEKVGNKKKIQNDKSELTK